MKRLLTLLSMSMCFLFMVAENASMKITTIDGETTTLNLIDTTIARYIYSEDHTQLIIQVTDGYFIYDEMQEIIRSRNIELWGEGHLWIDQKRWKMPLVRIAYEYNDTTSGNWGYDTRIVRNVDVDFAYGWRFIIPSLVREYNPNIDVTLMNYSEDSDINNSNFMSASASNNFSLGPIGSLRRANKPFDGIITKPITNF